MSRLARGQAALIARLRATAPPGGAITYVRGAERVTITGAAWVGRVLASRAPNAGGVAVVSSDRDYLIPVAALPWEPRKGDRIEEVVNGTALKFDVLPPGTGEPNERFSDVFRTLYRVHTKFMGAA